MRRTPTVAALAAASLCPALLAGCSIGAGTSVEGPGAEAPAESEAPAPAPADPTDPACLVGDWVISEAQMQSFYDVLSDPVNDVSVTIEGETGLSFTADTYEYSPDFVLNLEIAGVEGTGVTSGTLSGSWTASGGVLTTEVGENNLAAEVTVLDVTQDGTELLGSFITSDPINSAPFDCSDPAAPVIEFETTTGRTPMVLSARG